MIFKSKVEFKLFVISSSAMLQSKHWLHFFLGHQGKVRVIVCISMSFKLERDSRYTIEMLHKQITQLNGASKREMNGNEEEATCERVHQTLELTEDKHCEIMTLSGANIYDNKKL